MQHARAVVALMLAGLVAGPTLLARMAVKSEEQQAVLGLVRALRSELPVDPIHRAWRSGIAGRGLHHFAAHHASQPQAPHQPFDCAARHRSALACQLPSDLVGP